VNKRRTIFKVICFQYEYLVVVRPSVDENELIHIPLIILSQKFKDKVSKGLVDWIDGVYFVAKLESVVGFDKVYNITEIEEDIFPVPSWQELFFKRTKS
jgi:hypothetical protein